MPSWKAHALAGSPRPEVTIRPNGRVRAKVDLPGVPAGTKGRVVLANGFNWLRYRVRFANGVELVDLDGSHIESIERRRAASH